ncbi:putative dihydrodipicolinate synthase [Rhodotorula diobovata]|uniref:Putative dihydrodipicolinate synthase n=1 Tax=Rhodotorula diobovata TaxID=5288 RepID=A0A5C5G0V4_9BASI|nr:putative dihydrodipicolinate synthase [Rhodotorula diobovata]
MTATKFGRFLPRGVYAPLNTFYNDDESLDLETFKKHAQYVASAGVGLVALGSMGEAVQLTHEERNAVVTAAREALDADPALADIPLVVGTGAVSTRETIALTKEAAERGANYAMVIAPGYFAGALSKQALKQFFVDVAEASPIPVIVYNYPGAAAGIDIDSDLMTEIANASKNIVGTKLTCGSVGKLSRLTTLREDFAVLGGFVDFLAPSLFIGAAGGITGLANVAPKTCLKLYRDTVASLSGKADPAAAAQLQAVVSRADWILVKGGISGTKYALSQIRGYGGAPRRPLLPFDASEGKGDKVVADLQEILKIENSL